MFILKTVLNVIFACNNWGIESDRDVPAGGGGGLGRERRYYHSIGEGVAVRPGQRAQSQSSQSPLFLGS